MQMKCVMQGMPVCAIQLGWRVGIADWNILNGIFLNYGRRPVLVFRGGEMAVLGRVRRWIEVAGVGTAARVDDEIVVAGPAD